MKKVYLESVRLSFVPPAEKDLNEIEALMGDPLKSNHPGNLPQGSQIPRISRRITDHWKTHDFGTCLIYFRENNRLIGLGGMKELVIEEETVIDLGLMLLREYQKMGLGEEAGHALIDHAFHFHGFSRLVANTDDNNPAAKSLLTKWGFKFVRLVNYEIEGIPFQNSQLWELKRKHSSRGATRP